MGMLSEFKQFAMRGNVMDLAVGVVIGAAFGKIITALVDNVIMPPIGLLIGGVDFSAWKWVLRAAQPGHPAVAIAIGVFINTVIQFLIIALAIFLMVRGINKLAKPRPAEAGPPPPPPADVQLLTEIRDLLKQQQ
ncbi:large-conductance mechanosensitive channel protein MscL [Metallibacterium scheffleri]|uniref:large-conductance mechanosensitive channel protein MscL n=1 Tax=Metallibacterium scheffleri TaxID=993689 RepID=UPI0023F14056|nr:large-conductance mechanosensitive channel protein MscL [Metallibacterium scheffleri]